MTTRRFLTLTLLLVAVLASSADRSSANGRRGPLSRLRRLFQQTTIPSGPDLGAPLAGLTPNQLASFQDGADAFAEVEDISDGLGPIFNGASCGGCHSSPAVGGASDTNETRAARVDGGTYTELPGGSLFQSSAIRPDCAETVPADANVRAERQTQPLYGLGLVDAIPDWQIQSYRRLQAHSFPDQAGRINNVRDETGRFRVGRFGWKDQQPTLVAFSADAYLNEMGITNPFQRTENAPNGDQALLASCDAVADPEDDGGDVQAFADFMRLLAPPAGADNLNRPHVPSAGERTFESIGCAVCHTTVYRAQSSIAAINGRRVQAFSDLLLHDVGTGDGIIQGQASGAEFRTAPLWGLAASAPYLHDGSAATIEEAILRHRNQGAAASQAYANLSSSQRQALLDFLGSI
jgi:CxxC motif-containing protein (DUF1111 family)